MPTSRNARRSMAMVAALFAFIASSCGATVVESSGELAPAVDAQPDTAPVGDSATGHEYGASLDDWGQTVQESAAAADASPAAAEEPAADGGPANPSEFLSIEWDDLIPAGFSGAEIFDRYEERFDAVEAGSDEAVILYEEMRAELDTGAVNEDLDGQKIRLAGFVAPLTYEDEIVTEFLLVPTFGACIHVPPPPPNQTIMVTVDKEDGLTPEEAWGPVWVEGTIAVTFLTTDLAEASYTITSATSGVYDDF